jgi:gliding motility-associated-like protein
VQSTSALGVQHGWYLDTAFYSSARDTTFYLQNSGVIDSVFKITLYAYSGPGCADTIVQYITVHPRPTPLFGATEVCIGTPTQFIDSSVAAAAPIASWLWNFGDGNSSTLPNPSHTYAIPGLYPVQLTIEDTNACAIMYEDSVWVRSLPQSLYTMLYSSVPDSACVNDSIFFIDGSLIDSNGTAIVGWEWDIFNDGVIEDTLQNTSFVFANPGSFPVKLTVTSASNCSYSIIDTIHVSRPPAPFFTLSSYGGCTPVTVVATELSSGYITNYSWVFYTLDSNQNRVIEFVTTQQNPNPIPPFQANILSNKTVFAELTTSNSCYTATHTDTINIKPIPIPFFMFSSDTGCSPLSVMIQVDGLATGNPDSILFSFGDGSPNLILYPNINILPNGDTLFTWNQQAHTFTYTGTGLDTTYYVTLYASNECGDSSYTVPINVRNRSVQSFFTASTNVGCAPLNVSFFDYSFAATSISYCFDFDTISKTCNGNIFFGRNVTYPYTQFGTYVVAQFALNTCGMDTSYQIIEVRPRPNVQFTVSTPVCETDTSFFQNNTTLAAGNILGYRWDYGDGDSSFFTNGQHVYAPGTYTVCLTVYTDAGCDTTFCQNITVYAKPTANFSFQNLVCRNAQPIQFINSSTNPTGNIISYEWFFGDGNLSTQINPQHIYMNAGIYDVKLRIINDNFCKDSLIQQITIFAVPEAAFAYMYLSNDSCGEPQTINFTNNSNNAGGYYWDFDYLNNPGQDTSILMHPNHIYTQPGSFMVMLIAKNGLGCQDTAFQNINVHPIPEPEFTTDLSAGCAPLTVNFSNLTKLPVGFNDSIYYTWTISDGTVLNTPTPRHTFVNPGTYSVQLKARSEFSCQDSIQYNGIITVYPVPAPQFNYQLLEFGKYTYNSFVSGGTPPYSYYWNFGDGTPVVNGPDPTHDFDVDKVGWEQGFRVCLTVIDANSCDSTWCDTIILGAFTLYVPNAMTPDSDGEEAIFLPKGQGLESYTCRIFDRWGNILWESSKLDEITNSPVEGWDGTYNGEAVPAGVYIWRIDATFANGVIWRGQQYNKTENSTSGTITILR